MFRAELKRRRRGAVAPLAALVLIILIAMIALSVDMGYIAAGRSEIQNVADGCALAGADTLREGWNTYNLPTATETISSYVTSAKAAIRTFAGKNSVCGGTTTTVLDSDIEFGWLSGSTYKVYGTDYSGYPNSVKVTIRRDSTANNALTLFFAPVLGYSNVGISGAARATMYAGSIDSFNYQSSNIRMLPAVYDVSWWQSFLQTGKNSDGNTYKDSNGDPYAVIFPDPGGNANWGWISLDQSHVGSDVMKGWVDNGMSSSDLAALKSAKVIPLSSHAANTYDWQGENGKQEDVSHEINNYTGTTFLLPLAQAYSTSPYSLGTGQANKYYYDIVSFVAVKIVNTGNQNQVAVQPSYYIDPSVVFSSATSIVNTSSRGQTNTTLVPSKLTQ